MGSQAQPESNIETGGGRTWTKPLLLLLAFGQAGLFAGSFAYFFQGDSLYWLAERYTGWSDFHEALFRVDSYGYFRPLSHPLIPALLHPFLGLNPTGYHAASLAVFLFTTWILHRFLRDLSGSHWASFAGACFFGLHASHVFVTFDHAFAPELLYGLFTLLSALMFIGALRWRSPLRQALSCAFFALGLLSKEAAVTLPANLFLLTLALDAETRTTRRLAASLRAVAPHLATLGAYFGFLIWGVRGGRQLLMPVAETLDWAASARTAATNLGLSLLWGFNLPGAWSSAWRMVPPALEIFLAALGLATLVAAGVALRRPDRRKILIPLGLSWFVIALAPTLTLTEFKPYYLYAPLFGLSLAVGQTVRFLREAVPPRRAAWGDFALVLGAAMYWQSCHLIVRQDLQRHPLLGPAAEDARQAAELVKRLRPDPPPGSTFFIVNDTGEPLWWRYAQGRLFQLMCEDPSIRVLFSNLSPLPAPEELRSPGFLALQKTERGLIDVTSQFREDPRAFVAEDFDLARTVDGLIRVAPPVVQAGADRYVLEIPSLAGREAEILVRRDEGPPASFRARLDAAGRVGFFVSADTAPGSYEFRGARAVGETAWIESVPPARLLVK